MCEECTFDVFLSHSSGDKAVVRALAERLRNDGLKVWFDEWVLKPGDSIPAKIEEGLEQSRVLVLCMSANAFGSDWAQLESGAFRFRDPLNKGRRFVLLRLDDAPIKGSLVQFNYVDWRSKSRDAEYAMLLDACRGIDRPIKCGARDGVGLKPVRPEEVVVDRDSRDDFSARIKDALAKRVGMRCSNPACRRVTSGPQSDPNKAVNIGVAAHITAASTGGPRYAPSLSKQERSSIDNGIWLCQNCAKLVDNDEIHYTVDVLRAWKNAAESGARRCVETGGEAIPPHQGLSVLYTPGGTDSSKSPEGFWNVPFHRNAFFSGRDEILARLQEKLKLTRDRLSPVVMGITGLGGVGKTQVAVELAYRFRIDHKAVIWIRADSQARIVQSVLDVLVGIGIRDAAVGEPEKAAAVFMEWLQKTSGWLLVFDGADHLDCLLPYLPPTGDGSILITTRARNLDPIGTSDMVDLVAFRPEESLTFLLNRTQRHHVTQEAKTAAFDICLELGHLPLALEQASAYIVAKNCRFRDYLASYRTRRLELLERMNPSIGNYPASVATTWHINFREIMSESPASADLLRAIAFLSPVDIPLELIVAGADELSKDISSALAAVHDDPLALDDLIEPVTRYSLVRRNVDAQTLSMHGMVQEVLRTDMTSDERRAWMERIVCAVDKCFLMPTEYEHWPFCRRLVPHALVAIQYCDDEHLQTRSPGHLLNRLGCYLSDHARYSEADVILSRALDLRRDLLGPAHPFVAETLSNLGLVAQRRGDYTRAEHLHREAKSIVHESGTVQEAAAENNLGITLEHLGKFAEAEQAFKRSIKLKSTSGERQELTALTMANLASVRTKLGNLAEADALLREAMAVFDESLPPDHPWRATAMAIFAGVKRKFGETAEAESLLTDCLKIKIGAYGRQHPEVGEAIANLALLFADDERYDEAEEACKYAVATLEVALGLDHPLVAYAVNILGVIYQRQLRYLDAEKQLRRSIDILRCCCGPGSWQLADALGNFGTLCEVMQRHEEALQLARQTLSIVESCFGRCHPTVLHDVLQVGRLLLYTGDLSSARECAHRVLDNPEVTGCATPGNLRDATRLLAMIEEKVGNVEKATEYYRQYLERAEAELPPGRDLALAIYNYGAFSAEHGRVEDGVANLLRAVEIAASSLGSGSYEEGIALYGVGTVFSKTGRPEKAEASGRRALSILRKHKAKHPHDVLSCLSLLAVACQMRGKLTEADTLYREAIATWETLGRPTLKPLLAALSNYGSLQTQLGQLTHAKELFDLAVETYGGQQDPGDPDRAALYNSLAVYYQTVGDVENAVTMCKRALALWEEAGWPNHPNVLVAYKNYAGLLQTEKRFSELEGILPSALEKIQEMLGPNSRDEAIFLNDLGVAIGSQDGRWGEAERHFERALAVWEAMKWPLDEAIGVVHTNLLSGALKHRHFSVAVATAESEVAYMRRHYGDRHPVLVGRLNNVGVMYREWRRFEEAEDYFEQAIRMVSCTLGSEHPQLSTVLSNFARLRRAQGREQAAKQLEDKAKRAERRLNRTRKRHG